MFVVTTGRGASSPQSVSLIVSARDTREAEPAALRQLVQALLESPLDYECLFVVGEQVDPELAFIERLVEFQPLRYRLVQIGGEVDRDRGVMEALVHARGRTVIVPDGEDLREAARLIARWSAQCQERDRDAA